MGPRVRTTRDSRNKPRCRVVVMEFENSWTFWATWWYGALGPLRCPRGRSSQLFVSVMEFCFGGWLAHTGGNFCRFSPLSHWAVNRSGQPRAVLRGMGACLAKCGGTCSIFDAKLRTNDDVGTI
jgi:hypothetical protein